MDSPEEPTGLEFGTLDMAVPLAASANARCSWLLATGRAVCCPKEGRKHLAGPPGQPPGRQAHVGPVGTCSGLAWSAPGHPSLALFPLPA